MGAEQSSRHDDRNTKRRLYLKSYSWLPNWSIFRAAAQSVTIYQPVSALTHINCTQPKGYALIRVSIYFENEMYVHFKHINKDSNHRS